MNVQPHHFIDTHCHLDFCQMGDINDVIKQSSQANVTQFVVPSVDANNWQSVLGLSSNNVCVHAALGAHPYFLTDNNQLSCLTELATKERDNIVAIGEIGLDGRIEISQSEQIEVLKYQLKLAKTLALPVICHGHKSIDVLLKYLRLYQLPRGGVIHGFSGSLVQATEFIKLGFCIGVGGVITYERAKKTRDCIAKLPLTSLLLETDSPDMPICGLQGQPNHPMYIHTIAQCLGELHHISLESVAKITTKNAQQLFEI